MSTNRQFLPEQDQASGAARSLPDGSEIAAAAVVQTESLTLSEAARIATQFLVTHGSRKFGRIAKILIH